MTDPPRRRENPVVQGMRYGLIAVVAFVSAIVLFVVFLGLLFGGHGGAALLVLLLAAVVPWLARRFSRSRT